MQVLLVVVLLAALLAVAGCCLALDRAHQLAVLLDLLAGQL